MLAGVFLQRDVRRADFYAINADCLEKNAGFGIAMTMTPSAAKSSSFLRRMRPRTLRSWLLYAAGTGIILLVFAWMLSRMTPSWYQPLNADDVRVIDFADNAQKRALELHNTIGRVPLGEQKWMIAQDEINGFMAIRFAPPLNADGTRGTAGGAGRPEPVVSGPVVIFTPGKVTVSARTTRISNSNPKGGIGSMVFSVGIIKGADGKEMGLVKLTGVWVGCLPVPKSIVQSRVHAMIPSIAEAVQQAIQLNLNLHDASNWTPYVEQVIRAAGEGQPFPLEYTVDHKHIVIKELRVDEGAFTVVLAPPIPMAVMPRPANPAMPPAPRASHALKK